MSDYDPTPIPTHVQRAIAKGRRVAKRKAHSLHRPGSAATWWPYYLNENGEPCYITRIPFEKYSAMQWQMAAQKYYRGRYVVQITETPPNDQAHPQPGERAND